MGWYNGAGARKMALTITLPGVQQPIPQPDPATGLIECEWNPSYVLDVPFSPTDPTEWMSGIYLVRLTSLSDQKQSYIIFTVRDDARSSDLFFQQSVTTYEAYNEWGGKSLYTNPRAYKVSFNRPHARGFGGGDFIFYAWENDMVRFLEREGYDVTYTTDVDTHVRGNLLLQHKAFLSVGHDEYWSWQMRDNVESARDHGVSLGFFGSNASFWQIRFEPSPVTGAPDRTIVCYKSATLDPITTDGNPSDEHFATTQFRQPPVNRPEDQMIGVMFISSHASGDLVIANASHWVFQNTGLRDGDHLTGLLGYEGDGIPKTSPIPGLELLAHSPFAHEGLIFFADTTVYEAQSGATVFAAATNHWSWGLDTLAADQKVHTNPAVQQATRNILARFLNPLPYYLGPSTISFPLQVVGSTSATQPVTLVNHNNATLLVQSVKVTGDFQFIGGCGASLAENEKCTLTVVFKPTVVSARTGTLTVFTNSQQPRSVVLQGTATDFVIKAANPSSTVETVEAGQTAKFLLAVAPPPGAPSAASSPGESNTGGSIPQIALSCSLAPPTATCDVSARAAQLDGTTNFTVKVATKPRSTTALGRIQHTSPVGSVPLLGWMVLTGLIPLLGIATLRRTPPLLIGLRTTACIATLTCLLLTLSGCRAATSTLSQDPEVNTPLQTYTITVAGKCQGVGHSLNLTLLVRFPSHPIR